MKKNQIAIIIVVCIVLFGVGVGGVVLVKKLIRPVVTTTSDNPDNKEEFLPLDPSVTVDLTPRADGKAVNLSVGNVPSDTDSIEYEIAYDNDKGLRKGANGKIIVKGEKDITRNDILFGTCSKTMCTYDTGVTSVSLTLRFTSAKGVSVFTKDYPITQ